MSTSTGCATYVIQLPSQTQTWLAGEFRILKLVSNHYIIYCNHGQFVLGVIDYFCGILRTFEKGTGTNSKPGRFENWSVSDLSKNLNFEALS